MTDKKANHKFLCAFHPQQSLTLFCKCSHCLLPLCTYCTLLHQNQHSFTTVEPQIYRLQELFGQTLSFYQKLQEQINAIRLGLQQIYKERQKNEAELIKSLCAQRDKLITVLNNSLICMQRKIIEQIASDDLQFISEIKKIEDLIQELMIRVATEKADLSGEAAVSKLISFQLKSRADLEQSLYRFREQAETLKRRGLLVKVSDQCLHKISDGINKFMQLSIFHGNQFPDGK